MINSFTQALPFPSALIEDYALDLFNVDPSLVRGTFDRVYTALDNYFLRSTGSFLYDSNSLSFG